VAGVKKGEKQNVSKGDDTDVGNNNRFANAGRKITIIETEKSLEIESIDSGRIVFLIISVAAFAAGVSLILYEIITSGKSGSMMFLIFPMMGCIALFITTLALLNTRFKFDKERNTLTYSWWSPIRRMKTYQCSISDITCMRVIRYHIDTNEGWDFEICVKDGREFRLKPNGSQEEVEKIVDKISSSLGLMIERKKGRW